MDIVSYLLGRRAGSGSAGLKVIVVTELPDTGEDGILYLVPKQDTGQNDVFDEYLYVNDAWELIGTTEIDLSNYYTKTEIDAMNKTKYFYVISSSFSASDKAIIEEIHSLTNDERKQVFLFVEDTDNGYYLFRVNSRGSDNIEFFSDYGAVVKNDRASSGYSRIQKQRRTLYYTISTHYGYFNTSNQVVLSTIATDATYTNPFNPTEPYHPAPKKYVDDALINVAPAYSTSSTYSVGDCVIYDNKLYKCTTAITQAEAWTVAHWTQTTVLGLINDSVGNINTLLDEYVTVDEEEY